NYCFLSQISDQPHYGGANFIGQGDQRGDFMLNSNAAAKFTILVEIKKPSTNLLAKRSNQFDKYRNGAYRISSELTGGIAQLQINCKTWQRSAYEADNYDILSKSGIFTVQPKGILVVGNTSEFENRQQAESFELFRRNISNPEIITYDELLERAKFIVANERECEDENIELEEMDL
ncbi:MAG: Shedu immune nuclease family protein, partial [Syntrophothermus sp.]